VPSVAHCSFTARPANDVLAAPGSAELSSMPFGPAPYFPSALFFVAGARKLLTYFIFRADISGPRASRHRGINRALELLAGDAFLIYRQAGRRVYFERLFLIPAYKIPAFLARALPGVGK